MEESPVELYRKYRPTNLGDVVGQEKVVAKLQELGRTGRIPHFLMFEGASGCGKTTVARIVKDKMKCDRVDFLEINASNDRGIDMVRKIVETYRLCPMASPVRVYLIDEAHALTTAAQDALLKPLEEPPPHAYFFFCTTDPEDLKATIKTRATRLVFDPLSESVLSKLVQDVAKKEGVELPAAVVQKIATCAEGSARQALVILHAVIGLKDKDEQLRAIDTAEQKANGFQLAQALFRKGEWSVIAKLLTAIKDAGEEPEKVRQTVLSYSRTILLKKPDPFAAAVIGEFRADFFRSGHAGLAERCFYIWENKK
jgi:DNA polymerase-3 subunit gamma/tau